MPRNISPKRKFLLIASVASAFVASTAIAAAYYQTGHLSNVLFPAGDLVLISLDSGLPDNCAGTPNGMMMIPASEKTMKASILSLLARGDSAQTTVTTYTSGRDGSGFCQVNQVVVSL